MVEIVKRIFWLAFFFGLSGALFFGVSNSQEIIDWWKLRDYEPSSTVEDLATNAGFNEEGRRLFYVHDPVLLDKSTFGDKCVVGEETIVLGCYISGQKIFLFDVEDDRLEGVEEVTAAHEMLHAAFDRLSPSEQDELGELLITTFNQLDDPRIEETVRTYEQRDNDVVINELHSILGTEIRDLPGPLEAHYAQYFSNRLKVVDLAELYADEFERREGEIEAYDSQLEGIQSEIARIEADISLQAEALARERKLLEGLNGNPDAYNSAVDAYNKKVNAYNSDIAGLKSLVETYNTIVKERNEIALEERELVEAIDTRAEQL